MALGEMAVLPRSPGGERELQGHSSAWPVGPGLLLSVGMRHVWEGPVCRAMGVPEPPAVPADPSRSLGPLCPQGQVPGKLRPQGQAPRSRQGPGSQPVSGLWPSPLSQGRLINPGEGALNLRGSRAVRSLLRELCPQRWAPGPPAGLMGCLGVGGGTPSPRTAPAMVAGLRRHLVAFPASGTGPHNVRPAASRSAASPHARLEFPSHPKPRASEHRTRSRRDTGSGAVTACWAVSRFA